MYEANEMTIMDTTMNDLENQINKEFEKFNEDIRQIINANKHTQSSFEIYKRDELNKIEECELFLPTSSHETNNIYKPPTSTPPLISMARTLFFNHYLKGENIISLILDKDFLKNEMLGIYLGSEGFGVLKGSNEWNEDKLQILQVKILNNFINYAIALKKRDYILKCNLYYRQSQKIKQTLEPKAPEFTNIDRVILVNHLTTNNLRFKDKNPFFNKTDYQNILSAFNNKSIIQKININGQANYLGTMLYTLFNKGYIDLEKVNKQQIAQWGNKYFTYGIKNSEIQTKYIYKNLTKDKYTEGRRIAKIEIPLVLIKQ